VGGSRGGCGWFKLASCDFGRLGSRCRGVFLLSAFSGFSSPLLLSLSPTLDGGPIPEQVKDCRSGVCGCQSCRLGLQK
jgi:hypothetical protein